MAEIIPDQGVPLPGMPPNLAPERGPAWQPAFIAFCRGFPLAQIAGVYGIPMQDLERRALAEHWSSLAADMPRARTARSPNPAAADVQRIEANRAANYRSFSRLRDHLDEQVEALRRGELKIHRVFSQPRTGGVVDGYQDPGPSDLVSLATALKIAAEGTCRALGDVTSTDAPAGATNAKAPGITVLLPGVVSRPREPNGDEARPAEARVVDVSS